MLNAIARYSFSLSRSGDERLGAEFKATSFHFWHRRKRENEIRAEFAISSCSSSCSDAASVSRDFDCHPSKPNLDDISIQFPSTCPPQNCSNKRISRRSSILLVSGWMSSFFSSGMFSSSSSTFETEIRHRIKVFFCKKCFSTWNVTHALWNDFLASASLCHSFSLCRFQVTINSINQVSIVPVHDIRLRYLHAGNRQWYFNLCKSVSPATNSFINGKITMSRHLNVFSRIVFTLFDVATNQSNEFWVVFEGTSGGRQNVEDCFGCWVKLIDQHMSNEYYRTY